MVVNRATLSELFAKADRPGVRAFFLSMAALSVALVLALYSGAAAQLGSLLLASASALTALLVAGWVGVTLVPVLAKRTPLRFLAYRMEYKISREGWIYIVGIVLVALAAINTGNNLLFLILATLIATILMSGILSSITLAGVELRLDLPEHIFAGQPVTASVELQNQKLTLPSFSLRVEGVEKKVSRTAIIKQQSAALLETPVYFPYLPRQESVKQRVPLSFPKRGLYRQDAFRIVTRFPFGFLQKARRLDLATEALVYPAVAATPEFLDVFPGIEGALESHSKGRGQDLYALRGYLPNDSVRHVHWKASARTGSLMVREFARDDDSRVLLVFDPHSYAANPAADQATVQNFERAVTLCAALAWTFYERNALLQFRTVNLDAPAAPAADNIFPILRHLATVEPLLPDPGQKLLTQLAAEPQSFKIIITSQAHGSIPPAIWNSSYVVFAGDLSA
ncbi:MAG: DUF58 domain-containing protein [Candidatus Acidiferrum sp.]